MYDQLDWLTVNQLEFYHSVLMVYKIIKFGEPEQLATKLTRGQSPQIGTVVVFRQLFVKCHF